VTYDPDVGYVGADSFTFRAFDGLDYSNTATVSITVTPVNSGPITWYVATTGDDLDDCLSAVTPCRTVQEAVARAAGGDTIMVAAGVYAVNRLWVDKNLAIVGAGITAVLDGGGAGLAVGAAPGVVLSFRSLAFADTAGG